KGSPTRSARVDTSSVAGTENRTSRKGSDYSGRGPTRGNDGTNPTTGETTSRIARTTNNRCAATANHRATIRNLVSARIAEEPRGNTARLVIGRRTIVR